MVQLVTGLIFSSPINPQLPPKSTPFLDIIQVQSPTTTQRISLYAGNLVHLPVTAHTVPNTVTMTLPSNQKPTRKTTRFNSPISIEPEPDLARESGHGCTGVLQASRRPIPAINFGCDRRGTSRGFEWKLQTNRCFKA